MNVLIIFGALCMFCLAYWMGYKHAYKSAKDVLESTKDVVEDMSGTLQEVRLTLKSVNEELNIFHNMINGDCDVEELKRQLAKTRRALGSLPK